MKFVLSLVEIIEIIFCRHSKALQVTMAMQWAKSRPRVTFSDLLRPKSISCVTSNSCSVVISCPILEIKVFTFREWRDLSNNMLFVEIRWKIITQWLSKLYRKFVLSLVEIIEIIFCRHSKALQVTMAMQWAKSRPRVTFSDLLRPKSISCVTSNSCSVIISCPILEIKVFTFREWRDLSNNMLFVEIRWEIITQWLSKLYRSPATDFWLAGR